MRLYRRPRSSAWYIEWRDHRGGEHRWSAFTDRRASEAYGAKLQRLAEYAAAGTRPPEELAEWALTLPMERRLKLMALGVLDARGVGPAADHIAAFRAHMEARNRSAWHVRSTVQRITDTFAALGWMQLHDMAPEALEDWLKRKRDAGKAVATTNHYLTSMQSFANWCARTRRILSSPLAGIGKLPVEGLEVRRRRALEPKEVARLLKATRAGPIREGLSGEQRYWLYRFALETGLRRGEIRGLRVGSFDWRRRTVTVDAAYSRKAKASRVVALRPETIQELKAKWKKRDPEERAFQVPTQTATMLRDDLKAARIAPKTFRGQVDFHALRHTFATLAGEHAQSFRALMDSLGHRSPEMTQRYAHERLTAVRRLIEAMPGVSPLVCGK